MVFGRGIPLARGEDRRQCCQGRDSNSGEYADHTALICEQNG